MLRVGRKWLGKMNNYHDFDVEEARSLFLVKRQILRFIQFDEQFSAQSGTLKINTIYSKDYGGLMLKIETEMCILRFGKIETLRLLSHEPLFKNHVIMVTQRMTHGIKL